MPPVSNQQHIILGLDFLKKNDADIDFQEKIIKLTPGKGQIAIKLEKNSNKIERTELTNLPVYAMEELVLEDREACFISLTTGDLKMGGESYLFEGREDIGDIMCGIIAEGKTTVAVKNGTGRKLKIRAGEQVGVVSKLVEDCEEELEGSWTLERIRRQVDLTKSNLKEDEMDKVHRMLVDVNKALSRGDEDIGSAAVTPHKIVLSNETPIWQSPRTFALPINEEIENQCKELLATDIIEFSNSSWSSPCVPVRKADGQLRLCIDYRKQFSNRNRKIPDAKPNSLSLQSLSDEIFYKNRFSQRVLPDQD